MGQCVSAIEQAIKEAEEEEEREKRKAAEEEARKNPPLPPPALPKALRTEVYKSSMAPDNAVNPILGQELRYEHDAKIGTLKNIADDDKPAIFKMKFHPSVDGCSFVFYPRLFSKYLCILFMMEEKYERDDRSMTKSRLDDTVKHLEEENWEALDKMAWGFVLKKDAPPRFIGHPDHMTCWSKMDDFMGGVRTEDPDERFLDMKVSYEKDGKISYIFYVKDKDNRVIEFKLPSGKESIQQMWQGDHPFCVDGYHTFISLGGKGDFVKFGPGGK